MEETYSYQRRRMLAQLRQMGIRDEAVLQAMSIVKRHLFYPACVRTLADPYGNHPDGIGFGQTISQPYIVAYMLEKLQLSSGDRVLEVGTGSGYQAAVLCEMGMHVYSVETVPGLYRHSMEVLDPSVHLRLGDGWNGWVEEAPFKGIVVSCAPVGFPKDLADQLDDGGRMIVPVGDAHQRLVIAERYGSQVLKSIDLPVRFVPLIRSTQ